MCEGNEFNGSNAHATANRKSRISRVVTTSVSISWHDSSVSRAKCAEPINAFRCWCNYVSMGAQEGITVGKYALTARTQLAGR